MYSKPHIIKLASSIAAIQSNNQKVQPFLVEGPVYEEITPLAYEADE
jgi:hypothetical protein